MDSDLEDVMTNKIWCSQKCRLPPRQVPHIKLSSDSTPDRLKMGPLLGYGKVHSARDHANRKSYVLKIVDKVKTSKTNPRVGAREISLLRVIQHPNVVELFEGTNHRRSSAWSWNNAMNPSMRCWFGEIVRSAELAKLISVLNLSIFKLVSFQFQFQFWKPGSK